jgi:hypothetical protein
MIPVRLWTPLNQLPGFARNHGYAGYVDEFTELAANEQRQSEMKTILLNALLKNDFVGDRVSFLTVS